MYLTSATIIIFSLLLSLTTATMLFFIIFKDWEDFKECLKYGIMPDWISALLGEWWEDWWAEVKLSVWWSTSVLVGVLLYIYLGQYRFPSDLLKRESLEKQRRIRETAEMIYEMEEKAKEKRIQQISDEIRQREAQKQSQ